MIKINDEDSLYYFKNLQLKKYSVVLGQSVRTFFKKDIDAIEKGFCFLPEWICNSMSEMAISSSHQLIFYPVQSFCRSTVPLETDWQGLICLVEKYRRHKKPIIILIAFPFGYVDFGVEILYEYIKKTGGENLFIFLDFAQSYGYYNFLSHLQFARSVYLSFNGNKLLSIGGALCVSQENRENSGLSQKEIATLAIKIEKALIKQKKLCCETVQEIEALFPLEKDWIQKSIDLFNQGKNRSNYHRTVVFAPRRLWIERLKILEEKGYGQTIHPFPQKNLILPSDSYLKWYEEIFLLFPTRRKF